MVKQGIKKILILAANPEDTTRLRLDKEVRDIDEGLRRSKNRDQFEIKQKWAVRIHDLRRALLDENPHIIHFCGHGEQAGIVLESEDGKAFLVDPDALGELFGILADNAACVVLNACYSEAQAEVMRQYIPYVIGMNAAIGDDAAIEFSIGFYDGIGGGQSIENAFRLGCNAIRLQNIPEHLTPVLKENPELKLKQPPIEQVQSDSLEPAPSPTKGIHSSQQANVRAGDSYQAGGDIIIQKPPVQPAKPEKMRTKLAAWLGIAAAIAVLITFGKPGMTFFKHAFEALSAAAQHPLSVGLYVLLVVSWLVISLRSKRHRTLLHHLEKLPEKDRLKALELEMGPIPKKGINAEQWLRGRAQIFKLARLGALCITAIIVLSLAVYYYLHASPEIISIDGQVILDNSPLNNATVTVIGASGQWKTDPDGGFHLQIPSNLDSDSISLAVTFDAAFQKFRHDTTVHKNAAKALQINLTSPLTHIIAGHVLEEGSGIPIEGAKIVLEGNRGSGSTDSAGYFHFSAKGKSYEAVDATITHPNYQPLPGGLTISTDNQISLRKKQ
ncbi:CHAT domain-containing protein [candidate division KSB1 bacterium]|nr:CHAT domain-containing protein [candidate division KSB1 bacterium]